MQKSVKIIYFIVLISYAIFAFSCSKPGLIATNEDEQQIGPNGYYAASLSTDPNTENDILRKKLSSVFLVEQFNAKIFPSMKQAIKEHAPAGIVFWNPDQVTAEQIFKVNSEYSIDAEAAGLPPLLLSTDHEGGGLTQNTSLENVAGAQRFVNGFTKLAHPAWLGVATNKSNLKLCKLHGKITAIELKKAGFNFPLATISDLSKHIFSNRGISKDPAIVAACLKEILDAYVEEKNITFVTKHFPGLSETVGDTHDQVVLSNAKTIEELKPSLAPFEKIINYTNRNSIQNSYTIMASHAKYEVLDKENQTTTSKVILTDLLRKQMHYKGVIVSDAMWMGDYKKLSMEQRLRVYTKSILAGMDLLMISGKSFPLAVQYFRAIYDDQLAEEEKEILAKELNQDWNSIRKNFIERIKESTNRIERLRASHIPSYKIQDKVNFQQPMTFTELQRKQYYDILSELGMTTALTKK